MGDIINILKSKNYQIPELLLFNYKKMNITDSELVIIIYLLNNSNNIYNPKKISQCLNIELNNVLELISSLCEKGIINISMDKSNGVRSEILNLDLLYEKLAFTLDEQPINNNNLYEIFETEFGRTLSPIEYEIIQGWKDFGYTEEIIKLALKEAVYNGVNNLRYIDKIIYEWNKKGIKTKEDVEKDRKAFKNKNKQTNELFDYDWLNDDN